MCANVFICLRVCFLLTDGLLVNICIQTESGTADNISSRGKSKPNKDKDKDKEGKRGRGRGQRGSEEDAEEDVVEEIDSNLSTDAILRRKRKRRKTHKLGDDSLASIGLDDSGPALKRSRDAVKGTSYALSKYLTNSHQSGDSVIVGSKGSKSDSSLDTLIVRTNKRTKGANSILCKIAGKATGTGIRARAGVRAGTGTGTGTGAGTKTVKEKSARSKALVTVTQSDNDQDIRCD